MSYALVTCNITGDKLRIVESLFSKAKKYKIETITNNMNDCSIASFYVHKIKKTDVQFLYGLIVGSGYDDICVQWCSTTTYTVSHIN
jgi:hypothetical protein